MIPFRTGYFGQKIVLCIMSFRMAPLNKSLTENQKKDIKRIRKYVHKLAYMAFDLAAENLTNAELDRQIRDRIDANIFDLLSMEAYYYRNNSIKGWKSANE